MKTIERFPLRINSKTIILVPYSKCNEEYARRYRERMGMNPNIIHRITEPVVSFSQDEIKDIVRMHNSRRTYKAIAKKYSVSISTIRRVLINAR